MSRIFFEFYSSIQVVLLFAAFYRHGDSWAAFRAKVSRVALSTSAAAQYTSSVSDVADSFIDR